MRFSMLGHLEVDDDRGRPVDLGEGVRRKVSIRHLLSVLALQDWALSTSQLSALLSEGEEPLSSVGVRSLVYKTRRALGGDRFRLAGVVDAGVCRYRLVRKPGDSFDAAEFEQFAAAADRAREHNAIEQAADGYRRALRLWRSEPGDDLLPDLPMTAAMHCHVALLLTCRADVVQRLVEAELELGRHGPELVDTIRRCIAFDPLNERLYALLMLTLYRMGRRAESLAAFEEAVLFMGAQEVPVVAGRVLRVMRALISEDDPGLAHGLPMELVVELSGVASVRLGQQRGAGRRSLVSQTA